MLIYFKEHTFIIVVKFLKILQCVYMQIWNVVFRLTWWQSVNDP